jgi:AraC-like DNA-binding protein
MRYAEYPPTPRLAALVERFWLLEGPSTGSADAIIPDGRVELIFHYGAPFWHHVPHGGAVRQPAALLVGQMIEPIVLAPDGPAGVAAVRLRPAAARTLLAFSLLEVSGRFVDLEQVFPSVRRLRDELAGASCDDERIRALERWLIGMARPAPRPPVEAVVRAILESGGRIPIDALATCAGTSLRQMERQFREDVGLTPKTFSRIVRLQAALRRVRQGSPLTDVAVACGFYDQAHMTRDFRELASMSPGAWQTHAGDLAPLFVEAVVAIPSWQAPGRTSASRSAS